MTHTKPNIVIGVDGGGSACRFAVDIEGSVHEVLGGSANVFTDLEGALSVVRGGLAALAKSAGLTLEDLQGARAYLGLAGVISPEIAATVAGALQIDNAIVEDDRIAAVTGALGQYDGAVIGIGTGSFLARQSSGRVELIGGWGLVLGDEASGAVLGRDLLSRALLAADGLSPGSDLIDTILEELDGPTGVVTFASHANPSEFARFAPRIVEAAHSGDAVAEDLMRKGAAYIVSGLGRLGWRTGERLCPVGGLAGRYAAFLPAHVAEALTEPDGTALAGALTLARRLPERGGKA